MLIYIDLIIYNALIKISIKNRVIDDSIELIRYFFFAKFKLSLVKKKNAKNKVTTIAIKVVANIPTPKPTV